MQEHAENEYPHYSRHRVGRAQAVHLVHSGAGGYGQPQPVVEDMASVRGKAVQAVLHTHREHHHAPSDSHVSAPHVILLGICYQSQKQPCEQRLL